MNLQIILFLPLCFSPCSHLTQPPCMEVPDWRHFVQELSSQNKQGYN